jgi:hypothetical protein
MPHSTDLLRRPWLQITLLALCLTAGWTLSHLSPQLAAPGLMARILGAQQSLYYARVGAPGESLQYYVYASDFSALEASVPEDPGIVAFEKTILPRLATVTLSPPVKPTYERLRAMAGIESVIKVPYFCH